MKFFNTLTQVLEKRSIAFVGTGTLKNSVFLMRDELPAVISATFQRKNEYATGRWCARQTLAALGIPAQSILSGSEGEPLWPQDVCGSITHTKNAYCAATTLIRDYQSIGVDIESCHRTISPAAIGLIANADERTWLQQSAGNKGLYGRLIFSAKESIFKMFYPIIKKQFAFDVLSLLPIEKKGQFTFILNQDLSPEHQKGRIYEGIYFTDGEWLLTLCLLK